MVSLTKISWQVLFCSENLKEERTSAKELCYFINIILFLIINVVFFFKETLVVEEGVAVLEVEAAWVELAAAVWVWVWAA